MKNFIRNIISAVLIVVGGLTADAQKEDFNPIQTGVTSLSIAPDARGASLGDLGAATDPDVNSQYWNPSKYAFAYSRAGVALNYTPWLRSIVDDIFLANVTGYMKIGQADNQTLSASLRYFSLGEVNTGNEYTGENVQTLNPYELSVDVGYSRKLSESYSMGVVLRYIYFDFGFAESYAGDRSTGASAFSADVSGYYTSYPMVGRSECQFSWGWNISNIGTKVYNHGENPAFLPTNLRLGTSFMFPLADYHNLAVSVDANKLLVPSRPREKDYDMTTTEGQNEYNNALADWENMSSITGIFKSFSDAPGGFSEELKEIRWSIGAEYSYNDQFFARMGYNYENAMKGNHKYFSVGAGFALKTLRLDAAYMIATAQTSPLDQTLRFTLSMDMDGLRELFN